jgi:hypothetical protein
MNYYVRVGGDNQGPLTLDQLRQRGLQASDYVWREGLPDWQPAGKLPELATMVTLGRINPKIAEVYTGDPNSPYASPISGSVGDNMANFAAGRVRQSGFGIASTIIGIATFAVAFVGLMTIGFIQEQGGNAAEPSPLMIVLSLGVCLGGPLFHVVGLILGIVGIFQHDRSKVFSIMGTVINGLVVVGGLAFIVVVVLIGMSMNR